VEPGFAYDSGKNPEFLSVDQLCKLIDRYVASPAAM